MEKWADYLISAVRYDANHSHITHVHVMEDNGATLGTVSTYTRQAVVEKILNGFTFETAYKNNLNNYQRGQKVFIIKVNNINYLKTVDNDKEEDNLESLPEF
ncbi:DUF3892 domain-containing protein [Vibrio cholerae]|uniref:DUF3892 domain-containing protein n=1 Tax=Vibrio cholerae TaxID=666 RepID=UPI0030809014